MFQILIPKWESCESNGNNFVMYLIQVMNTIDGKCHTIRKRYRDFHKLNKKIKKLIKTSIVFPPKRVRNNLNHKFVEQRRQALERYLQDVVVMDLVPIQVLHFLNVSTDLISRLERERTEIRITRMSPMPAQPPDNQLNDWRTRTDHNSYPMIAFRQDINNICCGSQTSSSSSLNDIIINGVIDGFYADLHLITN